MWWHKQRRHVSVKQAWVCVLPIPQGFFTLMNLFVLPSFTLALLVGISCKSQDSLLHLCVNQSWRQRSASPNWKKLCVPDAELDSMKVSFCQIRATDQKAYFMIKLLISCMHSCMHACMYIRYTFFLGQHDWEDGAMWKESGTTDKQYSNVNSRAHERRIMLFVLQRHLEQNTSTRCTLWGSFALLLKHGIMHNCQGVYFLTIELITHCACLWFHCKICIIKLNGVCLSV